MHFTIDRKLFSLSFSLIAILLIVISVSIYTINLLRNKDSINNSMVYFNESYKSYLNYLEDRKKINIENFNYNIKMLNQEFENLKIENPELSIKIEEYVKSFNHFCELYEKRGINEKLGLEGKFRESAHDLEAILANINNSDIQVNLLQVRRREKDYLLRRNSTYVSMIDSNIDVIQKKVNMLTLENGLKKDISLDLKNYKNNFYKMVDVLDSLSAVKSEIRLLSTNVNNDLNNEFTRVNEFVESIINFIIIFFILSLIFVFFVSTKLSKSIKNPIIKLSKLVKNIDENNFSIRAKIFSNDEIGELALAFNKMMDKLEKSYKDVEHAKSDLELKVNKRTEQLSIEIEERKLYETKLLDTLKVLNNTKDELDLALLKEKELSELKSRFVSMISHEYRTPLTVLLTTTYLLEKYFEMGDKENFEKKMSNVHSAINSMKTLLDETLTIDKIESGKVNIKKSLIDLNDIIKTTIHESEMLLKAQQKINFINNNSKNIILESDPTLLKHIISNLVNNAIKYSKNGTDVDVELIDLENKKILKIRDYGIGIPEENKKHMFSPFFRADNVTGISGTGLGLSIVKNFSDLLEIDINYESEENKGTTFELVFN